MNMISLDFEYKTKYLLNCLKQRILMTMKLVKLTNKKYHTVRTILKIPHRQNNSKNTTPSEQFHNEIDK